MQEQHEAKVEADYLLLEGAAVAVAVAAADVLSTAAASRTTETTVKEQTMPSLLPAPGLVWLQVAPVASVGDAYCASGSAWSGS